MTNGARFEAEERPKACPKCGHAPVAVILYGLPDDSEKLERQLKTGELVLGGCVIFGDDPEWECTQCGTAIFRTSAGDLPEGLLED